MLQTLSDYQDRMIEVTRRARHNLIERGPSASRDLDNGRMEMARLMTSYQLFVHRELFEPLIASGTRAEVQGAKAMKVECITLANEFREYYKYWAAQDVEALWAEYQPQALAMIERIHAHARNVRALAPGFLAGKTRTSYFGGRHRGAASTAA